MEKNADLTALVMMSYMLFITPAVAIMPYDGDVKMSIFTLLNIPTIILFVKKWERFEQHVPKYAPFWVIDAVKIIVMILLHIVLFQVPWSKIEF